MSQEYSSWLNENFFEKLLQKTLKNTSVTVQQVNIEACGANDGFLSTLLRVNVKYFVNSKDETKSFVVKMMTKNELVTEKVGANGYDVQNKEMMFFELIAPQMEKILNKIGEGENIFPKVFLVDREHDVIVFDDLMALNFTMADRIEGLNSKQTRLGLKKLARFHAASLVIRQKHPKAFDLFNLGMFNRTVDVFNDAFLSIYELAVEEVATWPGYETYAVKMKAITENIIENAIKCFDYEPDGFCVLNHGDVWTNNLMFKEGKNEEAILVARLNYC